MLRRLGFYRGRCVRRVEAVEVLGRHRDEIRLVLCDLSMPGMDGWETLAALRRSFPASR